MNSSEQKVCSSSGAVRSRLKGEDQADLAWFLVEGLTAFDKSPMGIMLERAELFTFGPRICPSCEGNGFVGDMDAAILGAIERAKKWQAQNGSLAGSLREWRKEHGKEAPPWYDDGQCKVCSGSGWVPRRRKLGESTGAITARPTGSSVNKRGGSEPSSDILERYGFVCRRVSRLDATHYATLAGFFGLPGTRWADDRGRIWGVLPLTPAGKKILKASKRKGSGAVLRDDEILNVEAELQKAKPMKTRGALFDTAHAQAAERLRAAEDAWGRRDGLDPVQGAERTLSKIRAALKRMAA